MKLEKINEKINIIDEKISKLQLEKEKLVNEKVKLENEAVIQAFRTANIDSSEAIKLIKSQSKNIEV